LVLRQPKERIAVPRAEVWAQVSLVSVTTVLVFGAEPRLSQAFLLLVPLLWAAMRMPLRFTTVEAPVSLMAALSLTAFGLGPLHEVIGVADTSARNGTMSLIDFVLTQVFVVSTLLVVLSLAITVWQRRVLLAQVGRSERIMRGGFEDALLGEVILTNLNGHLEVVEMNQVAADLLDADERGVVAWEEILGTSAPVVLAMLTDIAEGKSPGWRDEIELHVGDEDTRWAEIAASGLTDEPGSLVLQLAETTARKSMERELEHLAIHDTLTGLPNRSLLRDRLQQAIAAAEQTGQPVAVVVLDLDDFKRVNDAAGHAVGDEILQEAAGRLNTLVRQGDTVARLGGDEFAIVLPAADGPLVTAMTSRLRATFDKPFAVSTGTYRVSASMGVTASRSGSSVEQLLRDADTAMYMSKSQSRGQSTWFDESFHEQVLHAATVAAEFEGAIERGEITLHAQPIIDLATGDVVAAEVLVRWQHPTRGWLTPDSFIPLAEDTGLVIQLGEWVLREACQQLREWQLILDASSTLSMSVNLSVRQLTSENIVAVVRDAIEQAGIDPSTLTLEITETTLMHDTEANGIRLRELRDLGLSLAVDDFGTGYSSLSYLQRFPIDALKIDRTFVRDVHSNLESAGVVSTIIALARSLGLEVVAEGVENVRQRDWLLGAGDIVGQGYLYSPPLPAQEFVAWALDYRARSASQCTSLQPSMSSAPDVR